MWLRAGLPRSMLPRACCARGSAPLCHPCVRLLTQHPLALSWRLLQAWSQAHQIPGTHDPADKQLLEQSSTARFFRAAAAFAAARALPPGQARNVAQQQTTMVSFVAGCSGRAARVCVRALAPTGKLAGWALARACLPLPTSHSQRNSSPPCGPRCVQLLDYARLMLNNEEQSPATALDEPGVSGGDGACGVHSCQGCCEAQRALAVGA